MTPRPVASARPSDPKRWSGFPVTTAGEKPQWLEYSSMIHAITSRVRVDVRRGDVERGADHLLDPRHEGAGDALELEPAHRRGVAVDAALRSAEGHVDDRRLPGHQVREGGRVVLVHGRVVPEPALARSAHGAVLHAVAREVQQVTVVVLRHDLDLHRSPRRQEDAADLVVTGRSRRRPGGSSGGLLRASIPLHAPGAGWTGYAGGGSRRYPGGRTCGAWPSAHRTGHTRSR